MDLKSILSFTYGYISALSKTKLLLIINNLRENYKLLAGKYHNLSARNKELEEEILQLKADGAKRIMQAVNKTYSQPTSKQPEWEAKGVGNDGKGKKKGRGKKGRKGAGNKTKNFSPTQKKYVEIERCILCGRDLRARPALKSSNIRFVEDIPEIPNMLEVIEIEQEKKYCPHCKKVNTASSDLALPGSDFGLNTTIAICYYWLASCLSFPRISDCLNVFFGQKISTSGLSNHVIRIATIMKVVYEEILEDIKSSGILQADETGWRIKGKNWWLWVFGTSASAYYTIDRSRGKDVVRRVLGEIFTGVLVVDGWSAYLSLSCEQQSCMAHLLRKIRKLYAAFPKLRSVYKFYITFRKILRDGERLQKQRDELGEEVFKRRFEKLHKRLDELLLWQNPNDILIDIIKKVKRQRPRILTFVEHKGVPCHNNYGEYLIRIGVLKRKISSGSKSAKGARAYAILLSIYTTCKLRDIPFMDFIKQSLKHYINIGRPMLLKEYIENQLITKAAA
jgi:transposase